jgi:murein DD-endopeptidase MepM/ murein hydrolase activator NlpD
MSYVVYAAGKRVPGPIRAATYITLGCALLGGCSSNSERFSSFSFGSGYEADGAASSSKVAAANSSRHASVQSVSYQPKQSSGFQLASAGGETSGGYLQVSRVELPPLETRGQTYQAPRTRTADGYGPYNRPPVADGVYTGPRVYTPYDQPRGDAPSSPPPAYRSEAEEPRRYDRSEDRDPPPPPQSFYRRSGNDAPPYEPAPQPRVYEPVPERDYRSNEPRREDRYERPREYDRDAERDTRYQGPPRSSSQAFGPDVKRPSDPVAAERGEGKVVTVAPGDTLYSLAIRHGVTVDMIVRANGLSSRYVKPGQDLLIPRAGPAAYGQAENGSPKAQAVACAGDKCHAVKPGETIATIARTYGVTAQRLLEANNLPDARALKAGQTLFIPSETQAPQQAIASATPDKRDDRNSVQPAKPSNLASALPAERLAKPGTLQEPAQLKLPSPVKPAEAQPAGEPTCEAALANPLPRTGKIFRKPVEGMTIAQFGPQRDGTINEGVTISVPKGTPIKAAENGVVAYVGDELPGFGNLILIRHADEYVTAYAHADEILVKKCDVVKRGQIVAKAGATGDANQPQLHFEIRKNSKPVDPSPLLGS